MLIISFTWYFVLSHKLNSINLNFYLNPEQIKNFISNKLIIDFVMDQIRKEWETCDCLQGFQFNHSISGGTGSGMGTRLISHVREEFPDRIMESTTVFPSTNISDSPVEPYNSVLSVHQLVENWDFVNVIQNQSLYNMLSRSWNIASPSFDDFNYIIGCQMSDFSSSLRFSGDQNTNMRKTLVNIVPFPRLHFFGCSFAPLTDFTSSNNSKVWVYSIINNFKAI